MKMAKANNEDIEMAFELVRSLEQISGGYPEMPEPIKRCDEDDSEFFDVSNREQLERFVDYLRQLNRRGSLMRVVMGMSVLIDPRNKMIDPDDDCLAHHPARIAAEKMVTPRRLDEWHEDDGDVLWHRFPIVEPPYVGSPLDTDWTGTHTHWTPLPSAEAITQNLQEVPA